ncbi:MAG: hypothetical protein Q4G00_16110, partial [Clostridia bacterium]|nr:hypothetical protein [Clostridia bacterium]
YYTTLSTFIKLFYGEIVLELLAFSLENFVIFLFTPQHLTQSQNMRMNMQTQLLSNVNPIVVVHKKTATHLYRLLFDLEVPPGFGPGNEGFADL